MKIKKQYLEIPIECIKDLITEPCIKFSSEGLNIKAFSDCKAAMCVFNLPKEKFIEYDIVEEKIFKIDIDVLLKVMKRIKTKTINIGFRDERFVISDEKGKEYLMAVMYDDVVSRDIPELELKTKIEIESSKLKGLFDDANIIGEDIKINYKDKKLNVSSGSLNKFNYEIECNGEGEDISNYSLEYLSKIMVAEKHFKNVIFEFGSGTPCKLTFKDELEIQFILAARCE